MFDHVNLRHCRVLFLGVETDSVRAGVRRTRRIANNSRMSDDVFSLYAKKAVEAGLKPLVMEARRLRALERVSFRKVVQ